jgi:hypothetical protein
LLARAEEEVFGVTHAEVGGWLSHRWNLPPTLTEAIRLHHLPLTAKVNPLLTAIVHFADILARAARIGNGGDPLVPPLFRGVLHSLPLRLDGHKKVDLPYYLAALHEEMENVDSFVNILLGRIPAAADEEELAGDEGRVLSA